MKSMSKTLLSTAGVMLSMLFATSCEEALELEELEALELEELEALELEELEALELEEELQMEFEQELEADEITLGSEGQALMSCYGSGCNGKDPEDYGCDDDAVTPVGARKYLYDVMGGYYLGYVDMRYSKKCGAQWGRVYSNRALPWSKVALRGPYGSPTYYQPQFRYKDAYIWTTMRRAVAGTEYRVDGAIEGCTGACDSGDYEWVIW